MKLHEVAIRHPVFATMLSAVLVLFGIVSFNRIGLDRLPDIELPVISVITTLDGADPETVRVSITTLIEEAANSIPGLDFVESISSPGTSTVIAYFNLNKNIDVAFNEMQAKVNQVLTELPDDAETPVVAKIEVGGQPILWLILQGDRTLQDLNEYAIEVVKKRLETINGVGEIEIGGERRRTIRVYLDTQRMAALGVTTQDVVAAFDVEHVQIPGGFLVGTNTEGLLELDLEFHSIQELEEMVVYYHGNTAVLLKDVARIQDGLEDFREYARLDGHEGVGLGIIKVSGANTVDIINEVKRRLDDEIIPALPPGLKLTIASDEAGLIEEIIASLKESLVLGTLLAAFVVFIFLKEFRSTLIISTAIPVSLLGAVMAMYLGGYTFNVLTMLSLLLLIGSVVDDAIVVLENVYRHQEQYHLDPATAAVKGTEEVLLSVIASTLVLVAIFVPVIFLGGIIGRFFESFAVVVVCGILISTFVALTLTPMLCARYMRVNRTPGRLARGLEKTFIAMENGYRKLIELALRFRWSVIGVNVLIVLSSLLFVGTLGSEFLPEEDEGRLLVNFKTPAGSTIDYTIDRLDAIEALLNEYPEIQHAFTTIGSVRGSVNEGVITLTLTPSETRTRRQVEIEDSLRKDLRQLPGVNAFPAQIPAVGGQRGEPLQFAVKGPDLNEVARYAELFFARLHESDWVEGVDLELDLDLPQYSLHIDRVRARSLGLTTRDIAQALAILIGGFDIAKYNDSTGYSTRYDIRLQAENREIVQPSDLNRVYLRTASGELARLDTVATLTPTLGPAAIQQIDLQYAARFYATPVIPLGDALNKLYTLSEEMLPLGYNIQLLGEAEEFENTVGYVVFALVMAVVLMFMVLASQFNSYMHPFIIMLALPLAVIGGFFGLWIGGYTLNIYSMIGMILLMGLVAKNSILLIDLTNIYRTQGKGVDEALLLACPQRMRPVLMTSLTLILAMLPAALGRGAGADSNGPLAVTIIGGMFSSTLLTLVVIPAVYSLIENFRTRPGSKIN